MGTPDYIAPEQSLDPHRADIRADIYALGCTLYHQLVGHAPFPEGTAAERIGRHRTHAPRPLHELRTDAPVGLAEVLARMMAKDPADRPATPAEAAAELLPFAAGGSGEFPAVSLDEIGRSLEALRAPEPKRRSSRRLLLFVAGGLLAAAAVVAVLAVTVGR
jgi:serine/threonine protein kinase